MQVRQVWRSNMRINLGYITKLGIVLAVLLMGTGVRGNATNVINSKGFPPGTTVSLTGVDPIWATAGPATTIAGAPSGSLTILHTPDSIYFLAVVNDTSSDPSDAFTLRFAVGADCSTDFGVIVPRSAATGGTPTWGLNCQGELGWASVPVANFGVQDNGTNWVVEFKLPIALPGGPTIAFAQPLGFAFAFCDGSAFCAYNPWPAGASIHDPATWGQIVFDPKTTFADLSVLDIHTNHVNPDHIFLNPGLNSFQVEVKNPGGTTVPDAKNVRINLYLAARGIGEPWHRFDTASILNTDCSAPTFNEDVLHKADVCSGNSPQPDIETTTIASVVANTALYTVRNPVSRTGGDGITVSAGTQQFVPVVDWALTVAQNAFFVPVTVNGNSYDRSHSCLLAQVISPSDPNSSNDTVQVNMDFVVPIAGQRKLLPFSLAPARFKKYDPNVGKKMFLQVAPRNMDERFQFQLEALNQLPSGGYEADLKDTASVPVSAVMVAPPPDTQGKTLKENLVLPPRAGEDVRAKPHCWPLTPLSHDPLPLHVTPP